MTAGADRPAGDTRPLSGMRVLLGRPAGRGAGLAERLASLGADVQQHPLTRVTAPPDQAALDAAVARLIDGGFGWVGFTAVPAVAAVAGSGPALAVADAPGSLVGVLPATTRVAAVGPATRRAVEAAGRSVDLEPAAPGSASTLAAAWPVAGADGVTVLLPRSDLASPELPDALRRKGFDVTCVDAYRTVGCPPAPAVAAELAGGGFDVVLLTSTSSVAALRAVSLPASTAIVAIGGPTATAVIAAGLPTPVVAAAPTDDALVSAVLEAAGAQGMLKDTPAPPPGTPDQGPRRDVTS